MTGFLLAGKGRYRSIAGCDACRLWKPLAFPPADPQRNKALEGLFRVQ